MKNCQIPDEEFDPSYCAEQGCWNDETGGVCDCGPKCRYYKTQDSDLHDTTNGINIYDVDMDGHLD